MNYANNINAAMESEEGGYVSGLKGTTYCWRIYETNGKTENGYNIFWSDVDISKLEVGASLGTIHKYNTATGKFFTIEAIVGMDGQKNKVISVGSNKAVEYTPEITDETQLAIIADAEKAVVAAKNDTTNVDAAATAVNTQKENVVLAAETVINKAEDVTNAADNVTTVTTEIETAVTVATQGGVTAEVDQESITNAVTGATDAVNEADEAIGEAIESAEATGIVPGTSELSVTEESGTSTTSTENDSTESNTSENSTSESSSSESSSEESNS